MCPPELLASEAVDSVFSSTVVLGVALCLLHAFSAHRLHCEVLYHLCGSVFGECCRADTQFTGKHLWQGLVVASCWGGAQWLVRQSPFLPSHTVRLVPALVLVVEPNVGYLPPLSLQRLWV